MTDEQRNKTFAFVSGGAIGAGLTALLTRRPALAAPPEEQLEYIASLLENINSLVENLNSLAISLNTTAVAILNAMAPEVPTEMVLTPWVAKDPVLLYHHPLRVVGDFPSDGMVDMRRVKRLAIRAENSLDQAVQLQPVGNFVDSFHQAVNVGPPAVCPANGQTGFGLAWGDWQPYIGMVISAAIAPTAGSLVVWAIAQE